MTKTKRIYTVLMCITMIFSIIPVITISAANTCGNNLTWTFDYTIGTLTISGTGDMYDYGEYDYVYDELSGDFYETLTSAPWDGYSITTVIIEDGVTSIGNYAFDGCSRLTSVTIGNSVTNIGDYAFSDCTSLTSIIIPDNVTSIGEWAFRYCSSLSTLIIGSGVTSIDSYAFFQCSALQNVTIPYGVTSISSRTFSGCSSLTSVTIPNSVTSIGSTAFSGCTALASVTIPNSVTRIETNAFNACKNLTSITIPASVTYVDGGAFSGCGSLNISVASGNQYYSSADGILFNKNQTSLLAYAKDAICSTYTIPTGITYIGGSAFSNCQNLTSITIPNSVTSIGDSAFSYCKELTEITIPGSVTSIGSGLFYFCDNLSYVTLGSGVTTIALNMFCYCSNLTTVTIPNSVTGIRWGAFYDCTALTDIYYNGSKDDWDAINIDSSNNTYLTNATIHCNKITSFDTTQDIWNFSNNSSTFGANSEGYQILRIDYERLISNLSSTERTSITTSGVLLNYNVIEDGSYRFLPAFNLSYCDWGGSCYGMSSWVCLAKNNKISSTDIDASAATLYDVDFSLKTESAINYYHCQQYLTSAVNQMSRFMSLSQYQQIQNLETIAESANNGGSPFLIGLNWYKYFNADGSCDTDSAVGHAVVGYGLEKGTFYCTEPSGSTGTYDRKVLIYDCSYPNGGDNFDLYYNSSNGKWCIPGWGIVSTSSQTMNNIYNNGIFILITSDTSIINSIDYNTGKISEEVYAAENNTVFTTLSDASYTISWGDYSYTIEGLTVTENTSDEDIYVIMSANIDTDGNSHESTASIVLPSGDYSYTVTSDDSLAFSINYGDHLETVTSASGGTVTFNADGETSVSLDNAADCTISLTSNDLTTAYDTFVVTSAEASEVTASLADSGMLVTSDNSNDVSVFGLNASDSTGIAIAESSENMLITENDDGTLSAWSDEDSSGEYTTPIESEIIVTTWAITGYSNGIVTLTAPSDAEGDYYVTIAQYDDETGILIDYEIAVLTAESEKTYYQITTEKALSTGKIKIMLWDENLIPLTEAYEY
ncbi:MAG: leucine-rich repeat domain-containing protein [Clostridia bacterium]|nr:leucine-rich repeat domain-containing protein [Clostridia bacterium]